MGGSDLFDVAIATIFAREFLEGAIIIGQYRTVILRSPDWQDPERQKQALKTVRNAAALAAFVAILVCIAVAVPLAILSRDLNDRAAEIIEGVSKIVAAICILQLSLKIPKWLGLYHSKKVNEDGVVVGLTLRSIRFNVAWNIWREVAECGIFLVPFFLGNDPKAAIPISAVVGIAVGTVLGLLIYLGNQRLKNKFWLAFFMSAVLFFLSTGLFVGGAHEFEEITAGSSDDLKVVWQVQNSFWEDDRFPMVILKPFGYSSTRSPLQIACFWSWVVVGLLLHFWKWYSSKKVAEARQLAADELAAAKQEQAKDTSSSESEDAETGKQQDVVANSSQKEELENV